MAKFASQAEYYRHHRKVFELAQEMGCTPVEAELHMNAVQRREEHRALMARRGLKSKLPPIEAPTPKGGFDDFDCQHMMRN